MSEVLRITLGDVRREAIRVAQAIASQRTAGRIYLMGIPRGGLVPAYAVANALRELAPQWDPVVTDDPLKVNVFIDDIYDTGTTADHWYEEWRRPVFCLFDKISADYKGRWLVMPWEATDTTDTSADDIVTRLLERIGEDPAREGLAETPARVVKAWGEWFAGYGEDPAEILKSFEDGAQGVDELVVQTGIPVYSHCEHHLAPFFGTASIGYIPNGRVVGLSKLSRLTDIFAKRLQVQERLTQQIAQTLDECLKPKGVAVVIKCRHMCMESRGVRRAGTVTTTSAMLGVMRTEPSARAEFLSLIRGGSL